MRFLLPALIISIAMLAPSCVNDPAKVKSFTPDFTLPIQTAHNVDVLYSDSAKVKIHLTAPLVEDYGGNSPYTEMTKGVQVEFFDAKGKRDSYLTANYAVRRERQQIMEAKNNVVVVNTKGDTLNTEHLTWDGNKHKITTDDFVKITSADQVIWGTGLESDEMFDNYSIRNVQGSVPLRSQPDKNK